MFEHLQEFITQFGYIAVFLWAFIEGEVGMVLAGSVAHQGYLSLPGVALTAFLGGFLGDQFYFWLGRRYGARIFDRLPKLQEPAARTRELLERYNTAFILTNRFMYGVRIAGPIVVGTTSVSALRFCWLNMLSAAVWAITVTGLGYLFAHAIELVVEDIHLAERLLVGAIIALGAIMWAYHRWCRD
jgi:membrane protein DedA with SNARE-associated domain